MRFAELAVFLAPLSAFILWRWALARGLDGPTPRHLSILFVALLVFACGLVVVAERDRMGAGHYVPARLVDGHIVEGHME